MASLTPRIDSLDFNLIINGSMDYWQRGTSSSVNGYTADRFKQTVLSNNFSVLRESVVVPNVDNITYSLRIDCQTSSAPAAAQQQLLEHFVEQSVARRVLGKKARLIFWVNSPKTGQHNVFILNSNSTLHSLLVPFTVDAAGTWQKIVLDVDFTAMPNTIPQGSGAGLIVGFPVSVGSDRTSASANTWLAGDFKLLSGSPNLLDNIANNFYVTGMMLIPYEATSNNPPEPDGYVYAGKDILGELALCQRYFEKSYNIDTALSSITLAGAHSWNGIGAANRPQSTIYFRASKRIPPTLTGFNPVTGATTNPVRDTDASTDYGGDFGFIGIGSVGIRLSSVASVPISAILSVHWAADAEL